MLLTCLVQNNQIYRIDWHGFFIGFLLAFVRKEAEAAMDLSFQVELPVPWTRESALTRELFMDRSVNGKSRFYLVDPWHTIHLGVGKTWVACGVMMLQHRVLHESSMDLRIERIGVAYKEFCRRSKLDPIIRRIEIRTFGTTTDPNGAWSKAAVTSNFMMFLEDFCKQDADAIQEVEHLRIFVSCI